MINSKLGRVSLSFSELTDNPDNIATLFSSVGFVPLKITISPFTNRIEYTGYSKLFDPVNPDSLPPAYSILDGGVKRKTISFIKKTTR